MEDLTSSKKYIMEGSHLQDKLAAGSIKTLRAYDSIGAGDDTGLSSMTDRSIDGHAVVGSARFQTDHNRRLKSTISQPEFNPFAYVKSLRLKLPNDQKKNGKNLQINPSE